MPKLAILVKELKSFALDPGISDESFLNEFLSAFVIAGRIKNKNGEELYLDKTQTSLIMNQKADVHQKLRKGLSQYEIKEKTVKGMTDFIDDYLNPLLLSRLKMTLNTLIEHDNGIPEKEKIKLMTRSESELAILLTDLLYISLSESNREDEKHTIIWKCGSNIAETITGDLFQFGFDNRKQGHKNIVVIPVNTSFDTHITRKFEGNLNPIVSEKTIHGQWLSRIEKSGISVQELNFRIKKSLQLLGYKPISTINHNNDKMMVYNIGTCSVIETNNAIYFLVAISEFDEFNNARSDSEKIKKSVESILRLYDKIGQGYSLYMPLMGTGMSRAGLSIAESYKLVSKSIIDNYNFIHGHVFIVIKPESYDEIKQLQEG